ncbi:hypothetical protein ACQPWY_12165 [Pseudonocardia xinjiangensis]|uniref:hypothetical protein n=1 Tax=Pseudonocardia xinjiangensis TaxID=75289 RepID=UPI003D8CB0DB
MHDRTDSRGGSTLARPAGSRELSPNRVTFRIRAARLAALRRVTLDVHAGECVAIVPKHL